MNRVKRSMLVCVLAIVLTTLLSAGVVQAAGQTGAMWSIVPSPSVGPGFNILYGVTAISASNIWAVGSSQNSAGHNQTLIEHWNGSSWQVVPSPNVGDDPSLLRGVAAVSAKNIWAVGEHGTNTNLRPLIEHWNGTSWKIVASPNSGFNFLNGVAAVSANDVWTVGTLIEHWNGSSWKVVPSPNVGFLQSVAAVSANDIWAVGGNGQTLTEHWNGSSWQVVSSPNVPGSYVDNLRGVAVVSANDVWAVGAYGNRNSNFVAQALTEHWNGSSWQVVPSPNVSGSDFDELLGVAVASASDIWAVGDSCCSSSNNSEQTLIEHWNGSSWQIVSSPNVSGSEGDHLRGVARVPGGTSLWAVGEYLAPNGPDQTLTEFYH